jgi:hypothetical protein
MLDEHREHEEERYLYVVDILARRGNQLQAGSDARNSAGAMALEAVVLFLCGGLAAGILNRLGERVTDEALDRIQALIRRRRQKEQREATTPDEALAALSEAATLVHLYNMDIRDVHNDVRRTLVDLGYSSDVSDQLAHQIAMRLHS